MLAPNALVTVAEARAFGLAGTTESLELSINGVSEAFESQCARIFRVLRACATPVDADEIPTEWYQGAGRQELHLQRWPITAIEWVKVGGIEVTDFVSNAQHLLADGRLFRFGLWPARALGTNPLTGAANVNFLDFNIEVAYTAGYSATPGDLKMAVLEEVRQCESRASSGLGWGIRSERTPGGYQATYVDPQRFLSSTKLVLANYTRELY